MFAVKQKSLACEKQCLVSKVCALSMFTSSAWGGAVGRQEGDSKSILGVHVWFTGKFTLFVQKKAKTPSTLPYVFLQMTGTFPILKINFML